MNTDQMREAFEAWAESQGYGVARYNEAYIDRGAAHAWFGWRAALYSASSGAGDEVRALYEQVGRAMVEMTTTVRGPDEWLAIPEMWLACMKERDEARAACIELAHKVSALEARAILAATQRAEPVATEVVTRADIPAADTDLVDLLIRATRRNANVEIPRKEILSRLFEHTRPAAPLSEGPRDDGPLAAAIHWPECWDTAAYPTARHALDEVYEHFRCTTCSPSPQPTDEATDAGRWRTVVRFVAGVRDHRHGAHFGMPMLYPVKGANIMQGSVAEHFTNAIDAARLATPPDNAAGREG